MKLLDGMSDRELKLLGTIAKQYQRTMMIEHKKAERLVQKIKEKMTSNPDISDMKYEDLTVSQLRKVQRIYGFVMMHARTLSKDYSDELKLIDEELLKRQQA